jgi:hypothetical protein
VELEAPVVEAPVVALQVDGGSDVAVRGGSLRGTAAVRADGQSLGVRLEGVTTRGLIAGPVGVHGGVVESRAQGAGADAGAGAGVVGAAGGSWWSGRWGGRLRGAGGVAVVVVVGGLLLEVLRGRRREARRASSAEGSRGTAPAVPVQRDRAAGATDLVLDLGETRAP